MEKPIITLWSPAGGDTDRLIEHLEKNGYSIQRYPSHSSFFAECGKTMVSGFKEIWDIFGATTARQARSK